MIVFIWGCHGADDLIADLAAALDAI
jgi:hypothetical protein